MGSQPDFTILSDGLANASQELRKFPNIPVINQGQEILTAINSLRTHMDQGFQNINSRIDRVEKRIDSLETRLKIESHNQVARLFNSYITSPTHEFQKIRTIHNRIPQLFPVNRTALSTIHGPDLESLLHDYEIEPQRQLEAQKRQLKQFIGVVFQV